MCCFFDGVGIAVLRSISHFCPAHVAVGSEFQFAVGGRVVSISGFSFPVMAMHPALQVLSNLFPLRHYFLIYVSQTLNGYPMGLCLEALFGFVVVRSTSVTIAQAVAYGNVEL